MARPIRCRTQSPSWQPSTNSKAPAGRQRNQLAGFRLMNSKPTLWLLVLVIRSAFGQPLGTPRAMASAAPTITIITAPSGAMILNQGPGSSSLNLGGISYFKGASASGETSQRTSKSFVITTRFALRVDCPGSPASALVNVTMSRMDASASHSMAIDGIKLGTTAQTLELSVPCGSAGVHSLDVEVSTSTPAGSIESTVAFAAALKQ